MNTEPSVAVKTDSSTPALALLVTGDVALAAKTRQTLEKRGYQVRQSERGIEALRLLLDQRYDLLLADPELPDIPGRLVLAEALVIQPSLRQAFLRTAKAGRRKALDAFAVWNGKTAVVHTEEPVAPPDTHADCDATLEILRAASHAALECERLPEALRQLARSAAPGLHMDAFAFYCAEETIFEFESLHPISEAAAVQVEQQMRARWAEFGGSAWPGQLNRRMVGPLQAGPVAGKVPLYCIMVLGDAAPIGMLAIAALHPTSCLPSTKTFLYHAANSVVRALQVFSRLKGLVRRDPLTELYNRAHFLEELDYVRQMAGRHGFPLGLAVVDVDHFKQINDTHGHVAGDAALRTFAELLRTASRASDLGARIGGDEFAVLLPGLDKEDARDFARRFLRKVRDMVIQVEKKEFPIAASVGITVYQSQEAYHAVAADILNKADQALYRAKQQGRNRYCIAIGDVFETDEEDSPPPQARANYQGQDHVLSRKSVMDVLMALLATRMDIIGGHSLRTRELALELGRFFGLRGTELRDLGDGATLHDIGKFAIPDHVLLKDGPLTEEEWEVIRQHSFLGYQMLKPFSAMHAVAEIVRSHHERYDGKGYPQGLEGAEIFLGARLVALVDVYDATRARRPYTGGVSAQEALSLIRSGKGSHFDPELADVFERCWPRLEEIGKWD